MPMQNRTRVLVIGLDGGTWNIIKPLVEKGKLPTIAKLMGDGCHGHLESCFPYETFPAWKCYSTAKNPGKLGVYWFLGVDVKKAKFTLENSTSFRSKELWDYLGANDITCGVLDMPTTYPPRAIKGAMVSPGLPGRGGFAYPPSLEKELKDRFDYKSEQEHVYPWSKGSAIPSIKRSINQRFDVASYMLKELDPSFFHLTIFGIDTVQHLFWEEMEGNNLKYGKVIEDFWTLIDSRMGSLLEEFANQKTYVFLMSDHGQMLIKARFNISKWLAEKNLLTLTSKKRRLLLVRLSSKLGWPIARVIAIIAGERALALARSRMPRQIRNVLLHPLEALLDWQRSKVIPLDFGLLYINRGCFDSEEEVESFKESLIKQLREIEEPKTGEKLASDVYRREEIYWGKYLHLAPDIVVSPTEGYRVVSSGRIWETWNYSTEIWSGTHRLHGIFLALGPDIKERVEIEGARIYDLAPTILHLFGLPIPKDMDGRVLKEVFEEDSALAKKEIEYQELDEKIRVREKIRELKVRGKI
jgi:predicted AlkP superfamily phosphohydrolase/phosphomutase